MSYCLAIEQMPDSAKRALHKNYHDHHYGFPIHDDNELFGRLVMEINQAGLSWETILKKEEHFRRAYDHFDIQKVAAYSKEKVEELLSDPGIIRNRLKVNAAIANARTIIDLQKQFGSFEEWLTHHHPKSKAEWVKLFRKTFKFTGGEIVNEFLMSTGYLPGAHIGTCPVYHKIMDQSPMWLK